MDVGCCSSTLPFFSGVPWRACRLIDNPWSLTEAAPCRTMRLRCCASCCCGARYKSKEKTFPSLIQTGESSSLHLKLGYFRHVDHMCRGARGFRDDVQGPLTKLRPHTKPWHPSSFVGQFVLQAQVKHKQGQGQEPSQVKHKQSQGQEPSQVKHMGDDG